MAWSMPLTWMEAGRPPTWLKAHWPATHLITADSRWRCSREVSTILCVHERRCQPANCSEHGECVNGKCLCQKGWQGVACDLLLCQPPTCGPHGVCAEDRCICDAGWRGKNCSQECLPGFYGDGCNQTCSCANGGSCDPVHGRCTCPPGFHGETCKQVCPLGFFGPACTQECRCNNLCPCDPQTGSCNTTLKGEINSTLHKTGHCLAKQIFTSWKHEEEANRETPYLTERSWLIITAVLAVLLIFSLIQVCCSSGAPCSTKRQDYSYIPLGNVNGAELCARETETSGNKSFGLEDSDSQDEV